MSHLFAAAAVVYLLRLVADLPRHADLLTAAAHGGAWALLAVFYFRLAACWRHEAYVYVGGLAAVCGLSAVLLNGHFAGGRTWIGQYWPLLAVAAGLAYLQASWLAALRGAAFLARPLRVMALVLAAAPLPLVFACSDGPVQIATYFAAAAVYALAARIGRSDPLGYAAAAMANVAVILALLHAQAHFAQHPQFFLIPPGLTLAVVGHRLAARRGLPQGVPLRDFGLLVVFAASTADMFIAQTFGWPAVVLAVLCVAGILAAMLLRLRGLLYLATAFLLVDMVTQIYWAGRTNPWIWWTSGIVLGTALIVLFGIFERKRQWLTGVFSGRDKWQ